MPSSTTRSAEPRIVAAQAILASIFASQRSLKALAHEYKWAGLGNLLGDFGEPVATEHYKLTKAPSGFGDFHAQTYSGQSVQIKTNYAADQIGLRGQADLLLVVRVREDGSWEEIYYGSYSPVKAAARYAGRDNKHMIAVRKLRALAAAEETPEGAGKRR